MNICVQPAGGNSTHFVRSVRLTLLSRAVHAGAKKLNANYPPSFRTAREIIQQPVLQDVEAVAAVLAEVVGINGGLMDFSGKNIFISGGSSGIGLALAKRFTTLNANVTILARDKKKLIQAIGSMQSIRVSDQQLLDWISADVSDYHSLEKKIKTHKVNYDILINSAGLTYPGLFSDLSIDTLKELIDINYLGTINLTKILIPYMISKKDGYIVNLASLASFGAGYGYTAYAPTKFAIRGLSIGLRAELKVQNINISIVYATNTDTPQLAFELKKMPEITKKLNSGFKVITPEMVADSIIAGMKKKKFSIIPGNFFDKTIFKFLILISPMVNEFVYHYSVFLAKKDR